MDGGVNKGDGLAGLIERLGGRLDEVVAFGDGQNDVEFLSMCAGYRGKRFVPLLYSCLGLAMGLQSPMRTRAPRRPHSTFRHTATMRTWSHGSFCAFGVKAAWPSIRAPKRY